MPLDLTPWANFFVVTGSAAAALTGLMFVVVTLIASTPSSKVEEGINTFSTPNVVHFCAAFFVSAACSVPWHVSSIPSVVLALTGLFGVSYVSNILIRTKRQEIYDPVLEDWIWYIILPLASYAALVAMALFLMKHPASALFGLAGDTLLLIFIGIHNAWDVVTYIASGKAQ